MVAIMNKNGWFQTAWPDDQWHFDYQWAKWHFDYKGISEQPQTKAQKTAWAIMDPLSNAKLSDVSIKERPAVIEALNVLKNQAMQSWDTIWMMKASAWWTKVGETATQSIKKAFTVVNQLWTLQTQLWQKDLTMKDNDWASVDLSPLTSWIRSRNPWDTDAQKMQSTLIAMIPNLARGIYWEVWVLTDNDVQLYMKTIPNLKQTDQVKKAVLALTLRTVRASIKDNMEIEAWNWSDVSWLAEKYKAVDDKVNKMENELWIWAEQPQWGGTTFSSYKAR